MITLEHLRKQNQPPCTDWLYIVLSVTLLVGLILATPLARAWASYGW